MIFIYGYYVKVIRGIPLQDIWISLDPGIAIGAAGGASVGEMAVGFVHDDLTLEDTGVVVASGLADFIGTGGEVGREGAAFYVGKLIADEIAHIQPELVARRDGAANFVLVLAVIVVEGQDRVGRFLPGVGNRDQRVVGRIHFS